MNVPSSFRVEQAMACAASFASALRAEIGEDDHDRLAQERASAPDDSEAPFGAGPALTGGVMHAGAGMTPEFRVSTSPDGSRRWWQRHDTIPEDHTGVRPATEAESALMRKIVCAKGDPPLSIGKRIMEMLA